MNIKNILTFLTIICFSTVYTHGETTYEVFMSSHMIDNSLLLSNSNTLEDEFVLDNVNETHIMFGSVLTDLDIIIVGPNGNSYSVGTSGNNYTTAIIPKDDGESGCDYVFNFKEPSIGVWSYKVTSTEIRNKDQPIFLRIFNESHIKSKVLGGGTNYIINKPLSLAIFTLSNNEIVKNTSITGSATAVKSGVVYPVNVIDDGSLGDKTANDGVFTGILTLTEEGLYNFKGVVKGVDSYGITFEKMVFTTFYVSPLYAEIGGSISDEGIDLNGDGYIDDIVVHIPITIHENGEYRVAATLITPSGVEFPSFFRDSLFVGEQIVELNVKAESIKQFSNENGPYSVSNVLVEYIDSEHNCITIDRKDLLGMTSPWKIDEFQREDIELVGISSTTGFDHDGNGLYEILNVGIDVDVVKAGEYKWSARLVDYENTEIGFVSGLTYLQGSDATLSMEFSGTPIGVNGNDGPFFIKNLIIYGVGSSRIFNTVGETDTLSASLFEGHIALTAVDSLVDFESAEYWSLYNGNAILSSCSSSSNGSASLRIQGMGWQAIISDSIETKQLDIKSDEVSFDMYVGTPQESAWWQGTVHFSVHCPSADLYHEWVNSEQLLTLAQGSFSTVSFQLPQKILNVLNGDYDDCQFVISFSTPDKTGEYYIDNLKFDK